MRGELHKSMYADNSGARVSTKEGQNLKKQTDELNKDGSISTIYK